VTGLYDAQGRMLEQTENLPILSFSLAPVCQYIVKYFGDDIHRGDVIFHNDVFSLGNQNNDVAVYKPIFVGDTLVAWSACKGHQADIGGAVAGGYNPNATEVWQEALRIPPVKVYDRGKLRKDVWDLIFANIRFDIVAADMRAQIGSCVVGERGITKLVEKYGIEKFENHKEYLFDSTEKMMKAEIRTIPNGIYNGESTVYFDGKTPGSKYKIRVEITANEDEMIFDYSKTDPQTDGFVNGTYTSSASATILTFLQMINPNIPHNDGMVRPIKINIPAGTILNAKYPAATTFGNHLCPPNADAIIRALSKAIPDRITAGWNQLLCYLVTGTDLRKNASYVDIGFLGLKGGSGGTSGVDGYDHIGMIVLDRFGWRGPVEGGPRCGDDVQDFWRKNQGGHIRGRRCRARVRPFRGKRQHPQQDRVKVPRRQDLCDHKQGPRRGCPGWNDAVPAGGGRRRLRRPVPQVRGKGQGRD
jgi:N-methylhydantoinase B